MADLVCVPSARTVHPCPSGTAPQQTVTSAASAPEFYPSAFDHVATQDILVAVALVFSFFFGFGQGGK